MNTKVAFFITGISYGDFVKNVYECISDHEITCTSDVHDIIDDNIQNIMDEADMSVCFDHVVLYYKPTKLPVSSIKLIKSIDGILSFPEKRKKRKPKDLVEIPKAEEPPTEERKEYRSCWIQPNGKIIYVGFACHEEWASDYFQEREGDNWSDWHTNIGHRYCYEVLQSEGWARILGWTDPPRFSLPDHITPKQRQAIKEYCQSEGCDLPIELKN
jgi:hypothetical protein